MITIQKIALFFTIVGALNWGCIGFLDFNFVSTIFSENGAITNVIYYYQILNMKKNMNIKKEQLDSCSFLLII